MKTLALVGIMALVALGGCTVDQDFVKSMDRPGKLLFPDLQKVYEADPDAKIIDILPHLKTDSIKTNVEKREARLRLLKEWRANIESAKSTGMLVAPRGGPRTVRYDTDVVDRVK